MQKYSRLTVALCVSAAALGCSAETSGRDLDPVGGDHDASVLPGDPDAAPVPGDPDSGPAGTVDATAPTSSPDAARAPGCPAGTWAPGSTKTIQLSHGGRSRSYIVHVGSTVHAGVATPLLVNFHGLTMTAMTELYYTGTNATADSNAFVVVYPEGISSSFNAIGCCGTAAQQNVDDIGFTRAIVEDVAANVCVDRKRIYATGMSNGGFMAYRMACSASDLFAAVAPVAGALASSSCSPTRPVPIIAFHGNADNTVSYASDQSTIEAFRSKNGCTGQPVRTMHGSAYCDHWGSCAGGVAVELCTFPGMGHAWPMTGNGWAATPALWAFLSQYSMP
jgi:polyhydroxybutyrate depolymerase